MQGFQLLSNASYGIENFFLKKKSVMFEVCQFFPIYVYK